MATREREEVIDGKPVNVQQINSDLLGQLDLVFFAGKEGAKGASMEWADIAVKCGCTAVITAAPAR